jgi:hypothetical protein
VGRITKEGADKKSAPIFLPPQKILIFKNNNLLIAA